MSNKTTNTGGLGEDPGRQQRQRRAGSGRGRRAPRRSCDQRAAHLARGGGSKRTQEAFRLVATELPVAAGGVETENRERAIQMETTIVRSVKIFGALLQKAGPYLLLEILLPGGTLFALLLFLYKRRQQDGTPNAPRDLRRGARHRQGSRGDRLRRAAATASPRCGAAARASATGSKRWDRAWF